MTHEQRHYQLKAAGLTSEQLAAAILRWQGFVQQARHALSRKRLTGLIDVYQTELLNRSKDRTPGTQAPTQFTTPEPTDPTPQ